MSSGLNVVVTTWDGEGERSFLYDDTADWRDAIEEINDEFPDLHPDLRSEAADELVHLRLTSYGCTAADAVAAARAERIVCVLMRLRRLNEPTAASPAAVRIRSVARARRSRRRSVRRLVGASRGDPPREPDLGTFGGAA